MAWKAMAPADVCDVMDFWAGRTWPMTREEVHGLAVESLGWTTEQEDGKEFLVNSVSALSIPGVSTIGAGDHLSYLRFRVTDAIRDRSSESADFLGDAFARIVREGTSRWGKPTLKNDGGKQYAGWDVAGGARVELSQGPMSASAEFVTPQTVERDKVLGER
ncbi:MAG: DUF6301 family protein [Microbacterium sp.]